ncbi:MAG TPA: Crp/Fnr family transcriptional regulator [Micromonosporaceae bacterium]|nr:Crp/Fnr family transcriptional regulator [Micromonosporaceae bacterium]
MVGGIDPALRDLVARLPLFSGLTPGQLEIIRAGSGFAQLDKGEILFHQGDPVRGFFFVLRGQMQLTVSTADGAEKVVEIVTTGESFGEAVVFDGLRYPVTATALVDTKLLAVSSAAVLDLLDKDPSFGRRMLANMAVRLRRLIRDVEAYSLRSSLQRVIGFLLSEAGSEGELARECTVTLPMRKHVLASRLNIAPETLSRILRDLTADGLISVEGRRITLHDVPRLETRLELAVSSATT